MLFFLYDILHLLVLLVLIPYYLVRGIAGKKREGILERLGLPLRQKRQELAACHGGIWIHAVSVGETVAVKPLVAALKEVYPDRPIIFSTVTETGRSVAQKISGVDSLLYFPFDLSIAARRLLRLTRPSLIVIVETELWPHFLLEAGGMGVPVVIVNGRISDRSFGRYLRFRSVLRPVLSQVAHFCMQSDEDARRIIAIGAPPERTTSSGNLKYDIPPLVLKPEERQSLASRYRLPPDALIITAGSTHRGEERRVLEAYSSLVAAERNVFLVLVPRHPERTGEVGALLDEAQIPYVRRSSLDAATAPAAGGALLVDTVGELARLYAISDIVFVGGSLVPVGGHNILEPLAAGAPVIFGPYMMNFREISSLVLREGGGVMLERDDQLADVLARLADNPAERRMLAERGNKIFAANAGAVARHVAAIGTCVGDRDA